MTFAQIQLDVPIEGPFDYLVGAHSVRRGSIVVVPFRNKKMVGVVEQVSFTSSVAAHRLKTIETVFDLEPLSQSYFYLSQFVANYYRVQKGEALFLGLPTAVRRVNFIDQFTEVVFKLNKAGVQEVGDNLSKRARGKNRLLDLFKEDRWITLPEALSAYSLARAELANWEKRGWIERRVERAVPKHDPNSTNSDGQEGHTEVVLTKAQNLAVESVIAKLGVHQTWLIHGVTGSGKTEVYFEIMAEILSRKKQVLVLVPEINLTPQFEYRLRSRFPHQKVVTLNSSMTDRERFQNWQMARLGVAPIVLGTRLAVFAALPKLGLIVVDEEHDLSYKQIEGVRYSARDLAICVASQAKVPIILGSATPSLETYFNVVESRYKRLVLSERPQGPLPRIELIPVDRSQNRGISPQILQSIKSCIANGEQALVFMNRRGYASALFCSSCNWVAMCHRCSAKLTIHKHTHRMHCHYCGYQGKLPNQCGACGNQDLIGLGQGTQRIEDSLKAEFPDVSILRIDSDTTKRKGAFMEMRGVIEKSEVDIIVGTQMLAKGHDFPNLSLVVILGSDQSLFSSDFRATERLYQQLLQVSGRPGRGATEGKVVLQTEFPQHPVYQSLIHETFDDFAQKLLTERKEALFPPYCFQALLRVAAKKESSVWSFLSSAQVKALKIKIAELEVYDAVPSPIFKMAGLYRGQLLIQATSRSVMRKFLNAWVSEVNAIKENGVRFTFDIDPIDV